MTLRYSHISSPSKKTWPEWTTSAPENKLEFWVLEFGDVSFRWHLRSNFFWGHTRALWPRLNLNAELLLPMTHHTSPIILVMNRIRHCFELQEITDFQTRNFWLHSKPNVEPTRSLQCGWNCVLGTYLSLFREKPGLSLPSNWFIWVVLNPGWIAFWVQAYPQLFSSLLPEAEPLQFL
jgi:hypothetical protein